MTALTLAAAIQILAPKVTDHNAKRWAGIIELRAATYNVDPLLVVALVMRESSWNSRKVNKRTGAAGLMQIMPVHGGGPRALESEWNLRTGIYLLALALQLCGKSEASALSIYNGRGKCRPSSFSDSVLKLREKLLRKLVIRA